jgi:hypothetical protein
MQRRRETVRRAVNEWKAPERAKRFAPGTTLIAFCESWCAVAVGYSDASSSARR